MASCPERAGDQHIAKRGKRTGRILPNAGPRLRFILSSMAFGMLLATLCLAAEQPTKPGGETADETKKDKAIQPAVGEVDPRTKQGLNNLKVPPNAIIVIADETKDALKLVPRAYLYSPEEYQKLTDELNKLRALAKTEKPIPTNCRLTGRLEGELVRLQAEFDFFTTAKNSQVQLKCSQAQPRSVSLNGKLPVLHYTTEGYLLQVDEAGPHKATLDLDLAVLNRGSGATHLGFVLDLPRAAVTTLELDFPVIEKVKKDWVKEVRVGRKLPNQPLQVHNVNTRLIEDRGCSRLEAGGQGSDTGALGAVEQLDLTWKKPSAGGPPAAPLRPLTTANGRITVQVDDNHVTTVAEITLDALRGEISEFQMQAPAKSIVRVRSASGEDRISATVDFPKTPGGPHRIQLSEPTSDPLVVVVEVEQPRGQAPVGPFHVLGAFQQRGTILISAPADVRLRYNPRAEVSSRELTPEDARKGFKPVAAFTYWNLPAPEKPQTQQPLLNLEMEILKGVTDTRVDHTLNLTERGWHLASKFALTPPMRGGPTEFQVDLPPDFELNTQPRPTEPVQEIVVKPNGREAIVTLTEKQQKPFQVTLEGNYAALPPGTRQMVFELPRLKIEQGLDRGGEVTAIVPPDQEILLPAPRDPAREAHRHKVTVPLERMPGRIDLTWRPYRPDLPVDALVDIRLSGAQAVVRHRLYWAPSPQAQSNGFPLRVPEALKDRVRVVEPSKRLPPARDSSTLLVEPVAVTKTNPLVLDYFFSLPANGGPFAVPLVVPEQGTRGETRVRVWSDPGTQPSLAGGVWQEMPLEIVEDHDRLPDLVLRATRPDLPLTLSLKETNLTPPATILVDRALVRATVVQAGQHQYWASFRVHQLRAPFLDIELPAAPAALGLKVFLDGKALPWDAVSDNGTGGDTTRLARLKDLDANLFLKPAILDVMYQIASNQPAARSSGVMLGNIAVQTTLHAPLLLGSGDHVPVRWDVRLPDNWVPVHTGAGFQFEQRWGWRGWLLAPQPAVASQDLERWFYGDHGDAASPSASGTATSENSNPGSSRVVCWRTDLEALRVNHAPQQAWLLVCSLLLLAIGLGLYYLLVHRGLYWPVIVLLGVVAALVGLLWPSVLAVIFYGCQPGLVVLALVFTATWLLQSRYRRQVVFLPGFTRVKSASSLTRSVGSSHRGRVEPSTVDAPPLVGSSHGKVGSSVSRRRDGSQQDAGGTGERPA